jgi:hypothetical protein
VPARILERLLTIRPEEASFAARGFGASNPQTTRKLEAMLESFIAGYNLAIRIPDQAELALCLHQKFDNHQVGFAFEGVGLYLAMLDLLVPGKPHRLNTFFNGAGKDHDFITAVGAGFAFARLPWGLQVLDRYLRSLDKFVAWCVPCGYGFHQGYFHHVEYVDQAKEPPRSLSPLGRQLFDSGLGRSLWWVKCANPARIAFAIERFPDSRRAELWAGIGIAAAYAGGVGAEELLTLRELSGQFRADFLSGLPFSARLRQKGGNYSEITELACRVLLCQSTDQTADMAEAAADAVRSQVEGEGITGAYDLVRRHLVQECMKLEGVLKNG